MIEVMWFQFFLHAYSFLLQLHVTMMNATYRRDKSKGMTFDAREIHKEFGRKDWGEYLIREAQISKRFWYDSKGYFHSCGSLLFHISDTEKDQYPLHRCLLKTQDYDQW